ncbi:Protein chibby-like protein 1-like [Oopsacas minuta]|uniref:Protein chibby-like protein 1-like n=1 Tax=Oopsacas minuta TaxID=111878 RepID=A0AAV7KBQ2_9METZ|nr:Protein chibby-like protein 1-like [Oopsacas minuta]
MFKKRNSFKSSKKPHPRRSASLSTLNSLDDTIYSQNDMQLDYDGEIKLYLGAHELVFRGGEWIREGDPDPVKKTLATSISEEAFSRLEKENEKLQRENNALKYKFEVLLDMMTLYVAQNMPEEEMRTIAAKLEKHDLENERRNAEKEKRDTENEKGELKRVKIASQNERRELQKEKGVPQNEQGASESQNVDPENERSEISVSQIEREDTEKERGESPNYDVIS